MSGESELVAHLVDGDGYVCLHSHYVPGIDDGAPTYEEGREILRTLRAEGFSGAVATPHIRPGMFDNRPVGLREHYAQLEERLANEAVGELPRRGLAAEHFFDDHVFSMLASKRGQSYPGGHAVLIELPRRQLPLALDRAFFQIALTGTTVVLAHPERYHPFFKNSERLEPLVAAGVLLQLDLMSLVGHYGRAPRKAAERLLDEGLYFLGCTDMHRAKDGKHVRKAVEKLEKRVGRAGVARLLGEHPRRILRGDI